MWCVSEMERFHLPLQPAACLCTMTEERKYFLSWWWYIPLGVKEMKFILNHYYYPLGRGCHLMVMNI